MQKINFFTTPKNPQVFWLLREGLIDRMSEFEKSTVPNSPQYLVGLSP